MEENMRIKFLLALPVVAACTLTAFGGCLSQTDEQETPDNQTQTAVAESQGLEFKAIDDGNSYAMVGLGTCTDEDVVIPAKYNGKPVTQIGRYKTWEEVWGDIDMSSGMNYADLWYNTMVDNCDMLYGSNVKSVYIPEGVTTIGYEAFGLSHALESVSLPSTLTYLGESAFTVCPKLKQVTIPNGVTEILPLSFNACISLEKVTLGSNVTAIDDSAFKHCTSLSQINLPDTVTTIGNYAFSLCYLLADINLTDNLTSIGEYAFENCGFEQVYLGSGLTTIGNNAFESCELLTSVTIPKNLTTMGSAVFNGCSSITSVTWNAESVTLTNAEDVESNPLSRTFSIAVHLTSVVIGKGVKTLPSYLFYNCDRITSVTLPSTLTKIGDYAFYGCSNLAEVYLPSNVTIGVSTFGQNTILK
jgi:hypothetical protein